LLRDWERERERERELAAMGLGRTLEFLSEMFGGGEGHGYDRRRKRRQMRTVELKVAIDCEGCERKVKNALSHMKGSTSVSLCSSS
jgi:hypothetical protein